MQYSDEDLKLAVKHGAYWMDVNYPEWAEAIDLQRLNMFSCRSCIVGQAVGSYYKTIQRAAYAEGITEDEGFQWARDHGFQAPSFGVYITPEDLASRVAEEKDYYSKLEALWPDEGP